MNDLIEVINRIEENIDKEISYPQLCKGLGITSSVLQRIFPMLFSITLSDYIRKRRLTKAAFELRQTQQSVLEIALKYGYNSPDAFTNAFKKQHDATPSAVRKGAPIKIFNALKVDMSIDGGDLFDVEIKTLPTFYVAGLSIKTTVNNENISILWNQLLESTFIDDLISRSKGKSMGVCYDVQEDGRIKYMAGWEVETPEEVSGLPFEVVTIEQTTFAIIPCVGEIPASIHKAWQYILEQFLPDSGYNYSGEPDIEFYPEKVNKMGNQMQIWVPVK